MMFQKWINKKQHICFDIDELFMWQDKLDAIEDQEHPAWKLFDEFLWESECKLEFADSFLEEMEVIIKQVESGDYSGFVRYALKKESSDIIGEKHDQN